MANRLLVIHALMSYDVMNVPANAIESVGSNRGGGMVFVVNGRCQSFPFSDLDCKVAPNRTARLFRYSSARLDGQSK